MAERRILAIGGGSFDPPARRLLLDLSGADDPRVLFVPTAVGESAEWVVRFYEEFPSSVCRPAHVSLFGIPRPDLRELVLDQDLIFVGGGNTANMLAIWRVHGFQELLREAWERGIVLAGVSAGAICWFEAGVTDSFRAELDGMTCLGWLPGSCCPHYDGEEARRPAYHRLVAAGFPPGLAADDGCGLHYAGTELVEAVAWRAGARAYRVEQRDGEAVETPLEPRRLPGA